MRKNPNISLWPLEYTLILLWSWAWWPTPVIPALGRLQQDCGYKFKDSLGYTASKKTDVAVRVSNM